MKINEVKNGLEIHINSQDAVDYFLKLALEKMKNKKPYKYSTAYTSNFRIDVRFIEVLSKEDIKKRKNMLERAEKIKLLDFIQEFRSMGTKENQAVISQFCNVFNYYKEYTLEYLIGTGKEDVLKFRRVGPKALDLFEQFLRDKGFEFATWNGEEWI